MNFLRCLLLAGLLLPGKSALCQDPEAVTFRSAVSLVRVDVEVLAAEGAIATGLRKSDFRIFDQGTEQPVVSASFAQEPLDLVLLFDLSGHMRGKLLGVVRAVELGFHELSSGDRVCVMAYDSAPTELLPFTPDMDAVNQAIFLKVPALRFSGETALDHAVDAAAFRLRGEPGSSRRRAVLLVSDRSAPSASPVIRDLWQSDAVLGELVLGKASGEFRIPERGGNSLADRTGGSTVIAGEPGRAFQQAVRLLRRRYALFFAMPATVPGSERSLEVRLSDDALRRFPGARVRARTGYVVPAR